MTESLGVGDVVAGRFVVEDVFAEGSMSLVARARRADVGGEVALKVLHPDLARDEDLVERFLREARALARLRSEHVVRVHDVVHWRGLPCMVMELLVGEDFDRVLADTGPLPVMQAVSAVHQACDGVAEAHAAGLVHRDLKPANLFRTSTVVKVIDFGVAKAIAPGEESSLTGDGTAMGSPLYMAPEQLRCERVDLRADIWALGVTLHELLVGETPFEAPIPAMVLANVFSKPPHSLVAERDDVPRELEAVVRRCLEKDPARRFGSALALREALEAFL